MSEPAFAEIALGLPVNRLFHYRIPQRMAKDIAVGKRVWVPFRSKRKVGYVLGFTKTPEVENVKPILELIDEKPVIDENMLALTKRIADYYFASWGQSIEACLPATLRKGKLKMGYRKTNALDDLYPEEPLKLPDTLTSEQEKALQLIITSLDEGKFKTFLLHGITASGKTEIYLRAIKRCLELGKSSIVLVPEISLTPQTVERFKSRFGDSVAVLHSRLSEGIRFHEWNRIRQGEARIVVGARSAIFSPVKKLGIIIVDEEHETSYKQEETPRYHAREVALTRAEIEECALILGSATPLVESYYRAQKNEFKLLKLTKRIEKMVLPEVVVVDMKKEISDLKKVSVFSRTLKNKIEEAIKKSHQAILFLNRRGFATSASCRKCGFVVKCKKCDSVMVYHFTSQKLVCHWCNAKSDPPKICPECKSGYLRYFGTGTEKIEEELHRLIPFTKMGRMDTDSTKKRGTHAKVLGDFRRGNIQVLIGTQMIAKGLDFPNVTLVGVVSADTALNLPDFRSSERTFSLLTQVAGRAGRGELGGEVVIQTFAPDHYAIKSSVKHDYEAFYEKEIKSRKELGLPPFYHLVRITLQGSSNKATMDNANELTETLRDILKKTNIFVLGPVPAVIARLRGRYRWNIVLKGKDVLEVNGYIREALKRSRKEKGVRAVVDVDPMSM